MSGSDIALVITATSSLVGAMTASAALLIGVWNKRVIAETAHTVARSAETIEKVHEQTDGLTKQLVDSASINAEAVGRAKGVRQEEIRASALKEGQRQSETEAARVQKQAAKTQAEAADTQTEAAAAQTEAAREKKKE